MPKVLDITELTVKLRNSWGSHGLNVSAEEDKENNLNRGISTFVSGFSEVLSSVL